MFVDMLSGAVGFLAFYWLFLFFKINFEIVFRDYPPSLLYYVDHPEKGVDFSISRKRSYTFCIDPYDPEVGKKLKNVLRKGFESEGYSAFKHPGRFLAKNPTVSFGFASGIGSILAFSVKNYLRFEREHNFKEQQRIINNSHYDLERLDKKEKDYKEALEKTQLRESLHKLEKGGS
jgi:hypothetical protein